MGHGAGHFIQFRMADKSNQHMFGVHPVPADAGGPDG